MYALTNQSLDIDALRNLNQHHFYPVVNLPVRSSLCTVRFTIQNLSKQRMHNKDLCMIQNLLLAASDVLLLCLNLFACEGFCPSDVRNLLSPCTGKMYVRHHSVSRLHEGFLLASCCKNAAALQLSPRKGLVHVEASAGRCGCRRRSR